MTIRLRVLGQLQVARGERELALPEGRERALLAVLAAHYPRAASAQQLIDDIWGADPPAKARGTLRAYVSSLRRALRAGEVDEPVVITRPGGYALCSSLGDTLDTATFEALVGQAGRRRSIGQLDAEVQTLRTALELWRGPAFSEVADAPGVAPYALYLEEQRLLAIERLAEARLERGEHIELAPELASLCGQHPLRERLWGARMLALYRAGRQADALAVYHEARNHFREELGCELGETLRALELAILRQDPELALPAPASDRPLERDAAARARMPAPGTFVGRSAELDALEVSWSLAAGGSGQLALLSGEPGIGKSSLAGAFLERLSDRGATVLVARCDPDPAIPYEPFREAIGPLLRGTSQPAPIVKLAAVFPELSGSPAPAAEDPATARLLLFEAVTRLVLTAAADTPVAILLEDLHWAEESSLLLLRHLARRAGPAALLIIGTYRDTEVASNPALGELIQGLELDPGFTTLSLAGLSERDVVALLAGSPSAELALDPIRLGALLHRATGGNPLFVRHMLAHLNVAPEAFLTETGALKPDPPLPAGIRDAIARRLDHLAPETVDVLVTGSVIGAEFDLELLQACIDVDALDSLEDAERAGLVVEPPGTVGRYRFAHDLVRQSLYRRPGGVRRVRLHERVGEALERLAGDDPDRVTMLAEHFAAAARRGFTDRAVHYALRAGRQALERLAFAEAARLAERGLRCLGLERVPDRDRRCELQLLLAEARLLARDIAGCKEAAAAAGDDARALGSAAQLARAAIVGSYLNTFGVPSESTGSLCKDALTAVGDSDPSATARVLAGWADYLASSEGDAPAAEVLSARAVRAARTCREPSALARALFVHGEVLGWSPRVEERLELADELRELARANDDPRTETNAYQVRALARLESGDVAGFDADVARIDSLRRQIDYWYTDMFVLLWRGMRALLDDRLDEVEPLATELLAHAHHEPNVVNLYAGQLILLRREQGRLGELRPLVLDAIRHNPAVAGFRCALAMIHMELGELDLAAEQLNHLAEDGFAALPRDATWTTSLGLLADVAATVRDASRSRTLFDLLRPYSGRLIVATKGMGCLGAADRLLGMLIAVTGDWQEADRYFRSALALERATGATLLVRRTEACRRGAYAGIGSASDATA